jgi:hypothetical protein
LEVLACPRYQAFIRSPSAASDADSLLPDLKLSSIGRLKLQASISNTGNAMQAQWSSQPIAVDATEEGVEHAVVIDKKN